MKKRIKHTKILRIDLDIERKEDAIDLLWRRLAYLNDTNAFHLDNIKKIELIKKSKYGCRILLKEEINIPFAIHLEMILGDDWRRNIQVMINYYKLNMVYYDRLFTTKIYPNGKILKCESLDVTKEIFKFARKKDRGIYFLDESN